MKDKKDLFVSYMTFVGFKIKLQVEKISEMALIKLTFYISKSLTFYRGVHFYTHYEVILI